MPTPTVFPSKKVTHLGFGMMVLIILTSLGLSLWGLHHTVGIFESVIHAEEVSDELLRVFADLKEAEDQQREYLLTGNAQFLDPYHQAVERTHADLNALENLAMTPTRRDQVLPDFKILIVHRLDLLQQILNLRDTQGTRAAIERIRSGEGMQLTAKIRQGVLDFHKKEVREFTRLHDTAHTMEQFTILTMSIGLILTFSLCLFTLWKFKRDLNERQQLERRLLEEGKLAEVSRRIADIGHDVKNMLTPIHMGMQLLEDELDEHFKALPDTLTRSDSNDPSGLQKYYRHDEERKPPNPDASQVNRRRRERHQHSPAFCGLPLGKDCGQRPGCASAQCRGTRDYLTNPWAGCLAYSPRR